MNFLNLCAVFGIDHQSLIPVLKSTYKLRMTKNNLNNLFTIICAYYLHCAVYVTFVTYIVQCYKRRNIQHLLCHNISLNLTHYDRRKHKLTQKLPYNYCQVKYHRHIQQSFHLIKVPQNKINTERKCFRYNQILKLTSTFFTNLKVLSMKSESEDTAYSKYEITDNEQKAKVIKSDEKSQIVDRYVKSESEMCKEKQKNDSRDNDSETQLEILFKRKPYPTTAPIYHVYMTKVKSHPQIVNGVRWNELNSEQSRLATFAHYPHTATKSAILLAKEGFAFCGLGRDSDDTVICYFCCTIKQDWHASDDIQTIHRNLSPDCCMVTGASSNNIPMTSPVNGETLFRKYYSQKNANTNASFQRCAVYKQHNEIETDSFDDNISGGTRNDLVTSASENSRQATSAHISTANQTDVRPGNSGTYMNQETRRPNIPGNQPENSYTSSNSMSSARNTLNSSSASEIPNRIQVAATHDSDNNISSVQAAAESTRLGSAVQTSSGSQQVLGQTSSPHENINESNQNPTLIGTIASTTHETSNQPQENASESTTSNSQNTGQSNVRGPTYGELGIITERPKRFEYAVRATRYASFEHWSRDHFLKKEDLADAGFYYAGYGDCARCFYCGGGLRNWEAGDNVWVEHARWFPKCAYVRQTIGQQFVDAVQDLNRTRDKITYKMVTDQIGAVAATFQLDTRNIPLKRDPAVLTVLDMGFAEPDVIEAANYVKDAFGTLSSDKIFEKLMMDGKSIQNKEVSALTDLENGRPNYDLTNAERFMNEIKEQNGQLRQQTVCKICMDKEVAVVFLPCGHFISCTDCAAAMKQCPLCRKQVRGIVRAFMS